jgi:ribonuclease P protein component
LAKQLTYSKHEKLKSKKQLDAIFAKGNAFLVHPLKVVYEITPTTQAPELKMGVGVSKKNFAKATDRNRIKRLIRESYRLNKLILQHHLKHSHLHIFILFIDKSLPENRMFIDVKMKKVMSKLMQLLPHETTE